MTSGELVDRENLLQNVSVCRRQAKKSLEALTWLYGLTQVAGQAEGTVEAKARDLSRFHRFYVELCGHDDPSEWSPSTTREFLRAIQRDRALSPATVRRVYSSVRHFAQWAHKAEGAFPHGCPTEGVRPPIEPEAEFKGLVRKDQVRLLNAAQTLAAEPSRGTNQGTRDLALVHVLLASALRVSELIGLNVDQFDGRVLTDVLQKGGTRRERIPLNGTAREGLETWLEERGDSPGPLFTTRTGRRITRHQVYAVLKRMEAKANAHLPRDQQFAVTPHVLRHTRLRRAAEERGIEYARRLSGHKSDKYIWRYIRPSEDDFEKAMETLD